MQDCKPLATHASPRADADVMAWPAKRSRIALTDADVVFAYCLAVFVAAVIRKWVGYFDANTTNIFDAIDINAGELLALCAMASIALNARRTLRLTRTDFLAIAAAALFFLPPAPQNLPFVGATLAGAYFWRARRDEPALASLGQLWIAISVHAAWGQLVFKIFSAPLLHLETEAIAKLGQEIGLGLTVRGAELATSSDWSIYVLAPCSSFHNLSLAALVWLSLLKLGGEPIKRPAWIALLTGAVLIVWLNATRILLMTPSEAQYHYWHEGMGRGLFVCLTFAAIALPTLLAMRSRRPAQAAATRR